MMFSNTHTDQHFRIKYRHCLRFHANVYALDVSRIDYCNAVLAGVHDLYLLQLQRVLNAVARLIARERKYDSISATLRDTPHWLPIRQRVEFKLSVLVFKCLHNLAPSYLSTMCQPWSCCSSHKDTPIRSSQIRRGRTVHVEFPSSTATQLPSYIRVASWFETEQFIRANHQLARDCLYL